MTPLTTIICWRYGNLTTPDHDLAAQAQRGPCVRCRSEVQMALPEERADGLALVTFRGVGAEFGDLEVEGASHLCHHVIRVHLIIKAFHVDTEQGVRRVVAVGGARPVND